MHKLLNYFPATLTLISWRCKGFVLNVSLKSPASCKKTGFVASKSQNQQPKLAGMVLKILILPLDCTVLAGLISELLKILVIGSNEYIHLLRPFKYEWKVVVFLMNKMISLCDICKFLQRTLCVLCFSFSWFLKNLRVFSKIAEKLQVLLKQLYMSFYVNSR